LANLLNDIRQSNPRNLLLRSWLPSKSTLELYFKDPENFYNCMQMETDFLEMAWEIAPIFHSYWMDNIKDPFNELSVEFSFLPVFIKESNVQAARRIPEVLRAGGFQLTHKNDSDKLPEEDYISIINNDKKAILEKMAKKEHDLWVNFYTENGWVYDENRNDYAKRHNCLVPYNKLKEYDKAKDREIISKYPVIISKAGFGITRLQNFN
jgi:hypothetical protein